MEHLAGEAASQTIWDCPMFHYLRQIATCSRGEMHQYKENKVWEATKTWRCPTNHLLDFFAWFALNICSLSMKNPGGAWKPRRQLWTSQTIWDCPMFHYLRQIATCSRGEMHQYKEKQRKHGDAQQIIFWTFLRGLLWISVVCPWKIQMTHGSRDANFEGVPRNPKRFRVVSGREDLGLSENDGLACVNPNPTISHNPTCICVMWKVTMNDSNVIRC